MSSKFSPREFAANEAVELLHAWASRIADQLLCRALIIKGPALHRYGLRAERTSADVDVLVPAQEFASYCEAIERYGWAERPISFIARNVGSHSRTYTHVSWPCDLDVHRSFPGFIEDPTRVFDSLWKRRATMTFANVDCYVPSRLDSLIIMGLHSLRSQDDRPRHLRELGELRTVALSEEELLDLKIIAQETGSDGSLRDVLTEIGVEGLTPIDSRELREWRGRVAAGSHSVHPWLILLKRSRAREYPRIVFRALWPNVEDLRISNPELSHRSIDVLMARFQRLARGARRLPSAVAALYDA